MQQTIFALSRCLMFAALPGLVMGFSSDQPVRAEVHHVLATPYGVDDPDIAAFTLKVDLRLTNRSERVIYLPISSSTEMKTLSIIGVQSKQPDGTWAYITQSSWYDTGTTKYQPCGLLSSGRTEEIKGVADGLVVLKKQLQNLGSEPTLRLNLMFYCREPDGQVKFKWATTEAFPLRLPAQR